MGQLEAMHRKVFAAIHNDRLKLDKPAEIQAFMSKNGLDGARFIEVMNSFGVQTKARQAKRLAEAYKIDSVPALGIRDATTSGGSPGRRPDKMPSLADFLIPPRARPDQRRKPPLAAVRRHAYWLEWPASFVPSMRTLDPPPSRGPGPPRVRREGRPFQPLNVEADQPGRIDLLNQRGLQRQMVVTPKGTMTIRAGRIGVRETPDGYHSAVAIGAANKPATFRQKRDGVDEWIEARPSGWNTTAAETDTIRFSSATPRCAACAAARWPTIAGNVVSYDSIAGYSASRAAPRPRPPTPAGACVAC